MAVALLSGVGFLRGTNEFHCRLRRFLEGPRGRGSLWVGVVWGQASRLKEMRNLMQRDLKAIGRPFGEFIPGGNAAETGQIDKQIAIVKKIEIQGKKVAVPEALQRNPGVTRESAQDDDRAKKKAERVARREMRKKKRTK